MKKVISGIMITLTMLLPLTTIASAAPNEGSNSLLKSRVQSVVEQKIDTTGSNITIASSKTLFDFSGNQYELTECSPTGYFIIHPKSGVTVEYSTSAPSPYKGYSSNLYYGGPTYYYVKSGNSYEHTILKTTITDVNAAAVVCDKTERELESKPESNVQNYINGKTSTPAKHNNLTASANQDYFVKDPVWFRNLNSDFGYVNGGYCGYIAANILLKYWHYHSTIDVGTPYYYIHDTSLTKKLISIGGDNSWGTWALIISNTINTFCSQKNIPQCATWHAGGLGVAQEIVACHRPVILFGNWPNATEHAIVAYGANTYENSGYYTLICHYGYNNGYTNVHVCATNSLFVSNTQYNLPDSYQY